MRRGTAAMAGVILGMKVDVDYADREVLANGPRQS